MKRQPFSLAIITRNAAPLLPDCIGSVPGADEVLVVDSGSSDDTVALAERLGARVIHQEWLGYGPQKRYAALHAKHDWILSLDADERLTPELRASIERALLSSISGSGAGGEGARLASRNPGSLSILMSSEVRWLAWASLSAGPSSPSAPAPNTAPPSAGRKPTKRRSRAPGWNRVGKSGCSARPGIGR